MARISEWKTLIEAGGGSLTQGSKANFDVTLQLNDSSKLKLTLRHAEPAQKRKNSRTIPAKKPGTIFYRRNNKGIEIKFNSSVEMKSEKPKRALFLHPRFNPETLEHLVYINSGYIDYRGSLQSKEICETPKTFPISVTIAEWREQAERVIYSIEKMRHMMSYYGGDYKDRRTEMASINRANLGPRP